MIPTLNRAVFVGAAVAALAGCATGETPKPNFPINRPAEPAAAPPPAAAPAEPSADPEAPPKARPTSPVESRPIEPPAACQATAAAETRVIAGGRVIDVDAGGGRTHTVKAGETVYRIALGFKIPPEELARINGLGKQPWIIRPGQVLRGPGGAKSKAYVAERGDTMDAVAQRFGVTPRALASANGLAATASLRDGQRLKLPAGYRDAGPQRVEAAQAAAPPSRPAPEPARPAVQAAAPPAQVAANPTTAPSAGAPLVSRATAPSLGRSGPIASPPVPRPAPPPMARMEPPPAAVSPPPTTTPTPRAEPPTTSLASLQPARPPAASPATLTPGEAEVARLGRGRFLWPVRGEIISGYGPKGGAQRNDGVNIRARPGEPVRAVASGDIVYAGDQVPGFGNLVLIKHADGWVSAYGHLARIDVKIADRVVQGQPIGQIGATGGVPEPQLHLEIRYAATPQDRARPLDPMLVLPR